LGLGAKGRHLSTVRKYRVQNPREGLLFLLLFHGAGGGGKKGRDKGNAARGTLEGFSKHLLCKGFILRNETGNSERNISKKEREGEELEVNGYTLTIKTVRTMGEMNREAKSEKTQHGNTRGGAKILTKGNKSEPVTRKGGAQSMGKKNLDLFLQPPRPRDYSRKQIQKKEGTKRNAKKLGRTTKGPRKVAYIGVLTATKGRRKTKRLRAHEVNYHKEVKNPRALCRQKSLND